MIDRLDPFRDGKAATRIGSYMTWLIESLDAGTPRQSAIKQAHERYAGRYGWDKIVRLTDAAVGY